MKRLRTFFFILVLIAPTVLQAEDPRPRHARGDLMPPSSQAQPAGGEKAAALPEVKTYDELCHAIREARVASRTRVEKAVEKERVRQAWEIGRLIDAHVLQHKERADYDKQVIKRLAADLGMSDTELYYMLKFARAYSIFPSTGQLNWGAYRELLALNDPEQRKALAGEASKNNWKQKEIREAVRKAKSKTEEKPAEEKATETLTPLTPGQPGTYKIVLAKAGPYKGQLVLDLGFSTYFRLAEVAQDLSSFSEGDLVSFEEKEIQLLGKPRMANVESLLYTYKVWVDRVLDGDTIKVTIDLGFGITMSQTLRLRGIDAPELPTRDGEEAKAFVEERLPPGSLLFVKTSKSDKYDRYLADVFITDKNGEEQYLNNLLLEQGHAVRVKE